MEGIGNAVWTGALLVLLALVAKLWRSIVTRFWLEPRSLDARIRSQGIQGPPRTFIAGNMLQVMTMRDTGKERDMEGRRCEACVAGLPPVVIWKEVLLLVGDGAQDQARAHQRSSMPESDTMSWNVICPAAEEAKALYERIPEKDLVSSTSMLQSLAHEHRVPGYHIELRHAQKELPRVFTRSKQERRAGSSLQTSLVLLPFSRRG
ncbi:hypothetical protein SELMODRAFT_423489 [Selaginella moellendorffii]|uniref:Uncharacterized protein n=1 Tax=Selaginella moellendorffii TaxID=88036 RepID=D8SLV8_SELML|nr:hypothetical protein SELMODRAFT_423489 [Selaginella moellendorffii]